MMKHELVTPVWIQKLADHEVFVFGSNLAGKHGAGAALQAVKWGAVYGNGFGLHGKTFAIPTKDQNLQVLDINTINIYVEGFLIYARKHTELNFLVTEIGCGLAGYRHSDIAPLFRDALYNSNIYLPQRFLQILL